MADVTSSARERGQLILVGGLSLAVMFVVLALVLNSAIYTENLATRTSDTPSDTALQFRQDALNGAGSVIVHVNRNGDLSYSSRYNEYQATVEDWRTMHANYSAINGLLTEVDALDETGGTLIADDTDGYYTSAAGQSDWTVAEDVRVRRFRLSVDRGSLHSLGDSEFNVEIDDGGSTWSVAIYEESGSVKVKTYYPSGGTSTCTAEGSTVRVDITRGTLDGKPCTALTFMKDLSGTHDIRYSNAGSITGTYRLTVDRVEGPFRHEVDAENGGICSDSTYDADPDADVPYTTPAIYSATVDLVYDGPSVNYESENRVAPGEPGEEAHTPTVTKLDVSDTSGNDASLTVSWSVSDPDRDLDTVEVNVRNEDDGDDTPESSTKYDSTSGSTPYSEDGAVDDQFSIEIVVTDSKGNSRSVTETHVADGDAGGCPP